MTFREDLQNMLKDRYAVVMTEAIVKIVSDYFGNYTDGCGCCSTHDVDDELKEKEKQPEPVKEPPVLITDDDWILRNAFGPRS